jgi:type I restriction enzyme, S subunit
MTIATARSGDLRIPDHWTSVTLRSLIRPRSERNRQDLPLLSVVRSAGVIPRSYDKSENHNFIPDDLTNYKVVKSGDLVINKMKAWSGSVGVSSMDGIVSPAYFVYEFRTDVDARYMNQLLRGPAMRDEFARVSRGIRVGQWDLDPQDLKDIVVALPSLDEQTLIVRYLDNAELCIAQAIAGKNRVLSLLREAKASIITELVIGQSPNMKETGVPGIGEVPSHWRILRGKSIWRVVDVRSTSGQEERLSVSSARGIVPRASANVTMFQAASYVGHKVVRPGDLVINSLWAWATGLGVSKHHGIVSPVYGVYELVDSESDTRYLDYFLRSNVCQWQFQVRSKGIWKSRLALTDEAFLDMTMVVPPLAEQRAIAELIEERTRAVDQAMDAVTTEIALLREYRTKLISDVVTGKLDVREKASKMSDVDLAELATVLAGGSTNSEAEEDDDNADN